MLATRTPHPARPPVVTAATLEDLDVEVLEALIVAIDDRLDHTADRDVRARLERGRARLERALAVELAA